MEGRRGMVYFILEIHNSKKIHMAGAPADTDTKRVRIQLHAGTHRYTRRTGVRVCDGEGLRACARVRARWLKEGMVEWGSNGKHIFQPRRLFTSHFMAFGRKLLVSVERTAARGAIETAPRKQQINSQAAKLLSSPRNYQRPPFSNWYFTV